MLVLRILLFVVLSALCAVSPLGAQTLYGSLTGNITDASGAVVPNAKVEALNVATGVAKSTQTDERGSYLMSDLQPGTYKVTVTAPSFSPRILNEAPVSVNSTFRLDVSLSVT